MSELAVGQLKGLTINSNTITIPPGHHLYAPGSVVQVQTVRSDARVTMTAAASGNGLTISQLSIPITPKFANSKLIFQWVIQGEIHHDALFLVHKNGSLITNAGETGYNAESGNVRWSGYSPSSYDNNQDSTPATYTIQYFATAGSKNLATFSPAVKASSGTAHTFSLNRVLGSAGQDAYETMVSTGIVWEIAQ